MRVDVAVKLPDGQSVIAPGACETVSPVPSPPSGAGNDYFNALVKDPAIWKSYSLRDQAQLKQFAVSPTAPLSITYDPLNDPDPRKQDAAKVVIPTVAIGQVVPVGANSISNQVRLPTGTQDGHSYLFTWDVWHGKEFSYSLNNAGSASVSGFKTFQLDSPPSAGSTQQSIRFEINTQLSPGKSDPINAAAIAADGVVRNRYYEYSATDAGPNMGTATQGNHLTQTSPIPPYTYKNFVIQPETWTRVWVLLEQIPNDYDRISEWVADSAHNPTLILDRLQVTFFEGNKRFWLEFNTSTEGIFDRTTQTMIKPGLVVPATANPRPPYVAYVRNLAILRDVTTPSAYFARP